MVPASPPALVLLPPLPSQVLLEHASWPGQRLLWAPQAVAVSHHLPTFCLGWWLWVHCSSG